MAKQITDIKALTEGQIVYLQTKIEHKAYSSHSIDYLGLGINEIVPAKVRTPMFPDVAPDEYTIVLDAPYMCGYQGLLLDGTGILKELGKDFILWDTDIRFDHLTKLRGPKLPERFRNIRKTGEL